MKKLLLAFALVMVSAVPALAKGWDSVLVTGINVGNDLNGNASVEVYTNPITVYVDGIGFTSNSQWAFPLTGAGPQMLAALTDAFKGNKTVGIYTTTGYYTYSYSSSTGTYSRVRIIAVSVAK